MRGAQDDGVCAMMRGLQPLFGVAAVLVAASAHAQEMVEVPTPLPPRLCCVVVDDRTPKAPASLLFDVLIGPTYRRAFNEDFAGALVEVEVGAQNDSFGMGARLSGTAGATRVGLPYQMLTIGPGANFRLSPRLRLAIGATFGIFAYQRATLPGSSVWAFTAGANAGMTVDLVRTRSGGALYLLGRLGYDYIESLGDTNGSTVGVTAAIGYRH
ncbi:MAG: hypothetical protein ACXVDD_17605 [Polyangia bacterium]